MHRSCTNLHKLYRTPARAAPHPFTYTPNPPQSCIQTCNHSPTEPRINSRIFLFVKAQGDGASNSPHHLKVANPSTSVPHTLSGGNGACAVGGMIMPPNGVQGQRPWHAFGSFRRETKGTRGAGRSARIVGRRGCQPRINFPRVRGGAPASGVAGATRPAQTPQGAGLKRSRNRKKVVAKKANLYDNKGEPK